MDTTPNVVIENPNVRKVVNVVLGTAGIIISAATIVDLAIEPIDYAFITGPAATIVLGLAGLFGLSVTVPNVPKNGVPPLNYKSEV
jgi:hypothetical protein